MSGYDIDRLGVEMAQGRGGAAGRQFDHMLVAFVVAVEITERPFDAVALARPRPDLHGLHVFDINAADQRRALALAPVLIHIDTDDGRLLLRI